jgi:hypothetical protein
MDTPPDKGMRDIEHVPQQRQHGVGPENVTVTDTAKGPPSAIFCVRLLYSPDAVPPIIASRYRQPKTVSGAPCVSIKPNFGPDGECKATPPKLGALTLTVTLRTVLNSFQISADGYPTLRSQPFAKSCQLH